MIFWRFLAAKKVNCDEMDGDRPRLPANRNCYRLSRVAQISVLSSGLSENAFILLQNFRPKTHGKLMDF